MKQLSTNQIDRVEVAKLRVASECAKVTGYGQTIALLVPVESDKEAVALAALIANYHAADESARDHIERIIHE
jgi:DUF971 family protein